MTKEIESLFRLDGKVIVITGAAGLLGQKHAEAIAAYGGTPILLDLSEEGVAKLADKLNQKYNVKAEGFVVNITDESQIKQNSDLIIEIFEKIKGIKLRKEVE